MGRRTLATTLASSLLLAGHASAALPSIVMKGTKFFYENGTQFFIKGIAYQQDTAAAGGESKSNTYIDPLANETNCARDIPIMAAAGTNTIRTYAIDPTADHSACMKLLDEHGIYVVSDLSEPALSINRDNPSWDVDLFNRYKAVVDDLQQYSNVIGFFAGNEVTNNKTNTGASAFVKAAVRDVKAYIKEKNYRWMGVGYAANDDSDIRTDIAYYFNCGNSSESIDFWGYNIYSWCGSASSYSISGYDKQTAFFSNYSVPVFFAEYGCNTGGAESRVFDETTALYGSDMSPVFSGGIVYMYFEETNDYGLVTVGSNGDATTMDNYNQLKTKVLAATPSSTSSDAYKPSNTAAACPAINENWQAASILPPTPNSGLCDCMFSSLSCAPANNLDEKDYGDIFNFICKADAANCAGFKANTTTGVYGAYVGCSSKDKLGYALDAYYKSQKNAASACDFSGKAQVVSASAASTCSSVLASASSVNAVAATATAGSATSSSSGDKKNSGISFSIAGTLYMAAAMAIGAGMIVL